MFISFAWIFLFGMLLSSIFQKLKLPGLVGMMIAGVILGPYVLDIIDGQVLKISDELRQFALVVILTRAGLSLDIKELKKVGRPALLMCFVPACFEILGVIIIGPTLLGLSILESAVLGAVLAAVSPAVIVPRMLKLMKEGYGVKQGIPQMIMAGASVDDVFVIVMFTAFTSLLKSGSMDVLDFVRVPISIVVGIITGLIVGYLLVKLCKCFHLRDSWKVLIMLSISFILLEVQEVIQMYVPMSSLLAIMAMGLAMHQYYPSLANRLEVRYSRLWSGAEILLFVLVGTKIDISYLEIIGFAVILVLAFGLMFRMVGVMLCLVKTPLKKNERLFTMIAYAPKATVQAAIGALPLSMGLACGEVVLAVSILSILLTAPIGAFLIDRTYKTLLIK
ncbi:NhaP-type Na+/H+ or K+/H+ antiporter [Breznakia sp. PF5-3]|uniref:cation:proton antiporter n=1 Tax=unclassified Breznakia TaxID=2623764 RepID=UPI002406ED77|nr:MULTISPECIES: cation:proton antiporter [unclassified Breznakia]MDF9825684.1 NhaP-type Na+/H+ or K+/H+ antiporter [Breznakia sp. PM6-1]MDF9836065.1 NhaP-type Na+/H+ or K+/H+ antiporter [Breznakia sp. PF5-3]MDF9838284.1 NhaP-type Na+/H+ or K+/H+ antiporter [Breznakia sp. PFB2-8]MDF9860320.1 NhaP-type Na+/H+ or K+/H+ antiporter [Breznakia sp. PH5-24]